METARRDPNFLIAAMLTAVLASIAPAPTAAETVSSSDCVNISVNTKRVSQLGAAISICTRVLGGNDLSPKTRTELLVRRGVAYRNVGDLNKSLADLGAAQDLSPGDPLVSRMLAWTYPGMGRLAEAEKEYGRALKLEPHRAGVRPARCRCSRARSALASNRAAFMDCWPRSTSRTADQMTRAASGTRGSASSQRALT